MPGPICTWERDYNVNDGTSCRMPSQIPGPMARRSPHIWERGEALFEAYEKAYTLAPGAVVRRTGYELGQLLKGLLPGLLQTLIILGATTALGAVAGGVIGFFFGGVGAAPGAVIGGEIGLDIGTAVLSWLGLAFLAAAIVKGFGELWTTLSAGIRRAWAAPESPEKDYPHEIDAAANELADAVGIFILLILQGIVAYVFGKAGIKATRGAVGTARTASSAGSDVAAAEAVTALVKQLRASKLGSGFADWVEQNWTRLRDDPRLRPQPKPPIEGGPGAPVEAPKPETPPEKPISEQSTAKKGIFGEYHADRYMEENGYQKLNGEPTQLTDSPKGPGIDGVYKNSSPPPEYVIGEAKYGSSQLGITEDGKQMSPEWVDQRLDKSVGKRTADQIREADADGQVERWVLRVDENGNVTKTVLKDGQP